ncbi:protein DpdD [Mycolicibacterium phocaicum]|uniref:protein DpdD n=1 Tax=Mycolicibacterium phocaicum TaxID=319706 RepID=UPI0022A67C54|nr:protein DpdD [Mycolicibacterium phocaicum]
MALVELVGDLSRFGHRTDRIEGLIESQTSRYRPNTSDWIILPWRDGFYLFSEDTEGQRRGRESVIAFLGPSLVSVESVPTERLRQALSKASRSVGFRCASFLRRVVPGQIGADEMLTRLEDMVATLSGRVWRRLDLKPTHTDLLRDFRLALLAKDDHSASQLLGDLQLNGHVSAENLRYLRVEYLGAFGRWDDLRALPHIDAMLKSRKPQAVSEILLKMVWWTELVGTSHQTVSTAFDERAVLQVFGPLLHVLWVPSSREGRTVAFLTALADNDVGRQQAILSQADDLGERTQLTELAGLSTPSFPTDIAATAQDPIAAAFEEGRFGEVVTDFVTRPTAEMADIAVQAVLEASLTDDAPRVLELVREFNANGMLNLSRRERRDLDELAQLVGNTCDGWLTWSRRLAAGKRWADGSSVMRDRRCEWTPIRDLPAGGAAELGDALLEAVGGVNDDQVRSCLDVLCNEAAEVLSHGVVNDFCHTVLLLLAEQENFSEMVRGAYLDLFSAWLESGPNADEYRTVLEQATHVWTTIASPVAVSWAIGVLEAAANSSCPDDVARTAFAVSTIERARQFYGRARLHERVEIESLAEELGLPSRRFDIPDAERDVWSELDGKLLGLYSLLPRAAVLLAGRLSKLSSVQVKGNGDKVATPGLRTLAERADYFIVDTWHAAHQATGGIDAVRSRDRQILPQQRGVTGFLRALEAVLTR